MWKKGKTMWKKIKKWKTKRVGEKGKKGEGWKKKKR